MKHTTKFLLCLLLAAMAGAVSAGPAQQLAGITSSGELRVGTPADYKPYTYRLGQSSAYLGLDIDLAAGLARRLGVKLTIVPTSWPTLLADWNADKFDLAVGGISITPERQQHGLFSIPYQRDGKTPITRCANQQRFQTLAQINQPDVRLIVNPGGTNERFARSHAPRAQLTEPVARAKWNQQAPIEDLPREALVIAAAVEQGRALGLPADRVEAVFHAQIEASKTVQRELYARWSTQHAGRFADAPDLAAEIRPKLDLITTQLLAALAANQAILADATRRNEVAQALRTLDVAMLSPAAAQQALAPLTAPPPTSAAITPTTNQ